jgi:oligopeptide transport system ATP-binding protein
VIEATDQQAHGGVAARAASRNAGGARIQPLLEVEALSKYYPGRRSLADRLARRPAPRLVALDDVSVSLAANETLGVVGESGSGKTTLARCIVRLVRPDAGGVRFEGTDVLAASPAELRAIRRQIQLIYQDPYSSLNPRMSVGAAIAEPARVHGLVDRGGEKRLVEDMLGRVGLPVAVARRRPRELSGGQRQRVAIARALAVQPKAIIADEAVSALDVSIQAQVLNLFEDVGRDLGIGMIFIAHQLSVIAHLSTRVAIMYLGRIVETGPTDVVFTRPRHPYTVGLLDAHPRVTTARRPLPALRGEIPSPYAIPRGCRFNTRCPLVEALCLEVDPPAVDVGPAHRSWCHVLPGRS